ncbi:glycogen synthase GlgA [Aquimarina addita]|uniref:Glycogen synthase n=1 Tax=Aquimarina addita TaxID=870485 RepID=A0ABP6UP33_9FLAO
MKILHTSLECYPFAKVGGLGDVVGSLPKYLNNIECTTEVIIPLYDNDKIKAQKLETIYTGDVTLGETSFDFSIKKSKFTALGFHIYFVDIPLLLFRPGVYAYPDDTERFVSFQLAILDWLVSLEAKPDVVHCHDHHTGLIPFMVLHVEKYKSLYHIPTVLTIHNAQYQGGFSYDKLNYIPPFNFDHAGLLDWDHHINPLATAIKCATMVNTVSPSYMEELQEQANGLEGLLSHEKAKCIGILNGIDDSTWDPETDPMIIKNYSISTLTSGRKANKKWLCEEFDLDINKPLFGFIGRLVYEKGADLLPDIISEALSNSDINILILGSGNADVEIDLIALKQKFSGRYNTFIGYDERLSHIVYAGADFLLMPSRVEPCGLNQMFSLRYGLIPIVRSIGGLKDTVVDIGDNGFGICHRNASVEDVCYSINRGIELYSDQKKYREIQKKSMKIDNSWNNAAKQYKELYKSLKHLK